MRSKLGSGVCLLGGMMICGAAYSHPGHGAGYISGLAHPLLGLDHLLAMLAVGIWAWQIGGRAIWVVPVSFVTLMTLTAGFAMSGIAPPFFETGVASSLLMLGLLIAFSLKLPLVPGATLVGIFAVFHGAAHGVEIPALATPWQYAAGFITSTLLLHMFGVILGQALFRKGAWQRTVGSLLVASGMLILAAR